jgi:hypothetical protein
VRANIGVVRELVRKEQARIALPQRVGLRDAAEEAALRPAHRHDLGAEAGDERHALGAHPVGHEDGDRMSQAAAQCRERDTGVAAGGLGDAVAGADAPSWYACSSTKSAIRSLMLPVRLSDSCLA